MVRYGGVHPEVCKLSQLDRLAAAGIREDQALKGLLEALRGLEPRTQEASWSAVGDYIEYRFEKILQCEQRAPSVRSRQTCCCCWIPPHLRHLPRTQFLQPVTCQDLKED